MSTAAQLAANRLNAAHSTGPKTPEGKAASRRNATSHGLSGRFSVLPHESLREFEELAARLTAEHNPEGDTETFLVDQMIQSRWKLARIGRLEALAMEQILTDPGPIEPDPDARLLTAITGSGSALDKLARYAATAERSYYKALRELQTMRVRSHKAEANALDAYIKKVVYAPMPGRAAAPPPCAQNEPNPGPSGTFRKPVLTPEEVAHPALRL